ncbi:MAG TPA: methyltransferase domain-containing protein [Chthoniobacteraceae bacterium]|jgi:SAM-dependent methyltransferase|nr:methyltransferase domain-containing protein [Chthoniobacteraceae bacterium]
MDWQARYEAEDTPWDQGEAHPSLVDYLKEGRFSGRVLAPGCGLGYDVRAISTKENRVTGLDLAHAAMEKAREFSKAGAEEFIAGDLFDLPGELRGVFDWVMEHTCFCAIEPQMREDYVRAVGEALKAGGRVFAIFYLNPGSETQPPFGVTVQELDELFGKKFSVEREWIPERTFEGREGRELVRILRKKI